MDTAGTGPRKVAEPPPASLHPARPLEGQAAVLPLLTSWRVRGWEVCNCYVSMWEAKLFGNGQQTGLMASGPLPYNGSSRLVIAMWIIIAAFIEYLLHATG